MKHSLKVQLFKKWCTSNLFAKMHRSDKGQMLRMFDQVELAALIRTILFRALHRNEFTLKLASGGRERFEGSAAFDKEYYLSPDWHNKLVDTVKTLRISYGSKIPVLDEPEFCLDYAYEAVYAERSKESGIRIVVGERAFIYRCMRACLEKRSELLSEEGLFTSFERELFYLYLVLQCNFRSEMIQNNGQVGFMNFKNYQDRKDDSWDESPYFSDAVRMAINNRIRQEKLVSLEGRVVPKAIIQKNIDKAVRYDTGKRFSDCAIEDALDPQNYKFNPELSRGLLSGAEWFYVFHFIKVPDSRELKLGDGFLVPCRHEEHRQLTKNQAKGLAEALRRSGYLRSRVRGIDSASDEVFCRPEVFACAFRYMGGVQEKWNVDNQDSFLFTPMRINKAYHAGEDFMDIAGGLRAIDEAIRYLHLGQHSRIGHGLALGVDPEIHYRTKHFESVMTRQERLDDLIWILFRGKELGVDATNDREKTLMARLLTETEELFRYIYGDAVKEENWDIDLLKYWQSMLLRGDDPSVYQSKIYVPMGMSGDDFNDYLIDDQIRELEAYRQDRQIAGLCFYYHYGAREGLRSQETYSFRVDGDYIHLMQRLQDAMIRFIHERGLIIETNPSSNVLIGTFKDYRHHPIFRFNNRYLGPGSTETTPKLSVCVNTDDLGVFDTTLEFEYALLYAALKERRNGDSSTCTYSDSDIMDYLDDLREQGLHAAFQSNREPEIETY